MIYMRLPDGTVVPKNMIEQTRPADLPEINNVQIIPTQTADEIKQAQERQKAMEQTAAPPPRVAAPIIKEEATEKAQPPSDAAPVCIDEIAAASAKSEPPASAPPIVEQGVSLAAEQNTAPATAPPTAEKPPVGKIDGGQKTAVQSVAPLIETASPTPQNTTVQTTVPPSALQLAPPPKDPLAPPPAPPVQPKPKPLADDAVLAHTNSLWKYQPLPLDEPDPLPEFLVGAKPNDEDWQPAGAEIVAARVRGKKHKHEGTNCDDWYAVDEESGFILLAVSDGAGSKQFSRLGAKASTEAAIKFMKDSIPQILAKLPNLLKDLSDLAASAKAEAVLASLVQKAALMGRHGIEAAFRARENLPVYEKILRRPLEVKDFSCTLLLAVVAPLATGEKIICSCQVGDGMIALVNTKATAADDALTLLAEADSGDFSGETDFITSPTMTRSPDGGATLPALAQRTHLTRSRADVLLLMTDGVADDYYPNKTEILRLYFDLAANGIIADAALEKELSAPNPPASFVDIVPKPRTYDSVESVKRPVTLAYTKDIVTGMGKSLADIWRDRKELAVVAQRMESHIAPLPANASAKRQIAVRNERLRNWLDNYTERGSFDDRTLVIAKLKG